MVSAFATPAINHSQDKTDNVLSDQPLNVSVTPTIIMTHDGTPPPTKTPKPMTTFGPTDGLFIYPTTEPATEITSTSARLNANRGMFIVSYYKGTTNEAKYIRPSIWFTYWEESKPETAISTAFSSIDTSNSHFSQVVSGLKPATAYSYMVEQSTTGSVANIVSFKTLPAEGFIYGDVDGDKEVTSTDYAYMKRYLLGTVSEFPSSNGLIAADLDGDMAVTSTDYSILKRYLLGKIIELPYHPTSTPGNPDTSTTPPTPPTTVTPTPGIVTVGEDKMEIYPVTNITATSATVSGKLYMKEFISPRLLYDINLKQTCKETVTGNLVKETNDFGFWRERSLGFDLKDLKPDTDYTCTFDAMGNGIKSITFRTKKLEGIFTQPAYDITETSAVISGSFYGAAVPEDIRIDTIISLYYWEKNNPENKTFAGNAVGRESVSITRKIENLIPNTEYEYIAILGNNVNTTNPNIKGEIKSFKTN